MGESAAVSIELSSAFIVVRNSLNGGVKEGIGDHKDHKIFNLLQLFTTWLQRKNQIWAIKQENNYRFSSHLYLDNQYKSRDEKSVIYVTT